MRSRHKSKSLCGSRALVAIKARCSLEMRHVAPLVRLAPLARSLERLTKEPTMHRTNLSQLWMSILIPY